MFIHNMYTCIRCMSKGDRRVLHGISSDAHAQWRARLPADPPADPLADPPVRSWCSTGLPTAAPATTTGAGAAEAEATDAVTVTGGGGGDGAGGAGAVRVSSWKIMAICVFISVSSVRMVAYSCHTLHDAPLARGRSPRSSRARSLSIFCSAARPRAKIESICSGHRRQHCPSGRAARES